MACSTTVYKQRRQSGFTIVELLIVVVVIAILAAITIVSYNGIQKRAKETAVISNLNGVSKQIKLDQVASTSEQYPASLSAANGGKGIVATEGYVYQYTVNNTVSPSTFCITASYSKIDYMITESSSPIPGVCAGHAAGGVAQPTITNLAPNPSLETNIIGFDSTSRASVTRETTAAKVGSAGGRLKVTSVASFPRAGTSVLSNVSPNTVYTFSIWAKSNVPVRLSYIINSGSTYATPSTVSNNEWVRITYTTPPTPANTTSMKVYVGVADDSPLDTTMDFDGLMITQGSATPGYADGSTAGWSWTADVNNSPSSGPSPL